MSGIASEISDSGEIKAGQHVAYFFETQSEKQSKLFQLARELLDFQNSFLLYIAGKQGVKGIRLSLKDVGFDVAGYERARQLRIVDSEEWYVHPGKQPIFRSIDELNQQFRQVVVDASSAGYGSTTIISETDMLVRKGFYKVYSEFDKSLGTFITPFKATLICAFDKREMEAAKIAESDLQQTHSSRLR